MKRLVLSVLLSCSSLPAFADCQPGPGLTIDQFQYACNADLSQLYYAQYANRMSAPDFLQMAYRAYLASTGGMSPTPYPPTGLGVCQPGTTRCRPPGWLDVCQQTPTGGGTWVTGAQRCYR